MIHEDLAILDQVIKGKIPKSFEEFKKVCQNRMSWNNSDKKLNRPHVSMCQRWLSFIQPTILAHLCGMSQFQWKKDFFQYVMDSKALSVSDINWAEACEKWPFCTEHSMHMASVMVKGQPLLKSIIPKLKSAKFPDSYFQRRIALIEAFEDLKENNG